MKWFHMQMEASSSERFYTQCSLCRLAGSEPWRGSSNVAADVVEYCAFWVAASERGVCGPSVSCGAVNEIKESRRAFWSLWNGHFGGRRKTRPVMKLDPHPTQNLRRIGCFVCVGLIAVGQSDWLPSLWPNVPTICRLLLVSGEMNPKSAEV